MVNKHADPLETLADALVATALRNDGSDNISLILVQITDSKGCP